MDRLSCCVQSHFFFNKHMTLVVTFSLHKGFCLLCCLIGIVVTCLHVRKAVACQPLAKMKCCFQTIAPGTFCQDHYTVNPVISFHKGVRGQIYFFCVFLFF